MYDKCYFCLDQLPKLKKESTASFFVNFGRSRGTKEPTYITVIYFLNISYLDFQSVFLYEYYSLACNLGVSVECSTLARRSILYVYLEKCTWL